MVLTFEEGKKHLSFIQSKNMQFCEVNDIYMSKQYDEILIACNVNQWDLYNSIIVYLHKMHITIHCQYISK